MKTNRLVILVIAVVFLLSLNFTFAVEDNLTQSSANADDNVLETDDTPQNELSTDSPDLVSTSDDSGTGEVKTIVMGKVTKRYNGAIQYSASFYDIYGQPLKDTPVIFEVDDYSDYKVQTDSNGLALLTVLMNKGNHKISAFNPETYVIDSAYINVFDVITGAKNINMYYDGGNTYKVRVFDDNGNPLKAGEKVTFAIGKKTYTKKTDKKGFATLKITSNPGLYQIGVKYKDYLVTNTLYVKQVLNPLTSFKNKHVKPTIKFKVKFLGKNKKNKKISVKFNKKVYKAKTNKKGIATFNLKTPKNIGKYKLVVLYKKDKATLTYTKYHI